MTADIQGSLRLTKGKGKKVGERDQTSYRQTCSLIESIAAI